MKSITATEAKQKMGELLESAILEPIVVLKGKNKRPVAVVLSYREYKSLLTEVGREI